MKIMYFLPKLENCGPANVVLNNIRELRKSNPEINIGVITYRNNKENDGFKISCQEVGIEEFYSLQNKNNVIQKYLYLKQITKKSNIIHSNGFFPDLYASILPKHLVKISTVHSIISKDYPATYGTIKGSIYALLHHLVYLNPTFDNIIACSNAVENHIKKYSIFNKRKILRIHNGIERNHFNKLSLKEKKILRSEVLSSLCVITNSKTRVFVYSGRLARLKRVPELIKWFISLSNPDDVLLILGDGEERRICEKVAKNATKIYFLGYVNETTPYYQIADYVVSNSSLEGFPMGILEGMSCGCRALLSDIPAHREIIKHFPNMATLFINYDSDLQNIQSTQKELFYLSATRMAEQYLSIYLKNIKLKSSIDRDSNKYNVVNNIK